MTLLFENRVMSQQQIMQQCFSGITRQTTSSRLAKLVTGNYLERKATFDLKGKRLLIYLACPSAMREIAKLYPHEITTNLCKSDSISHDLVLVEIRKRIESKACITKYLTENTLQACREFRSSEYIEAFVRNNTDAVVEIEKHGKRLIVGLEYERNQKASDRYTSKLTSYYAESTVPVVLCICENQNIIDSIAQAEADLSSKAEPKYFFALTKDILSQNEFCIFTNSNGDKIIL